MLVCMTSGPRDCFTTGSHPKSHDVPIVGRPPDRRAPTGDLTRVVRRRLTARPKTLSLTLATLILVGGLVGAAVVWGARDEMSPASPQSPSADSQVVRVVNCAVAPHECGYPDETNTGVATTVVLKRVPQEITQGPGWAWDPRGWLSVHADGAVLENVEVSGNVDVTASDVTVRNVRIIQGGETFGISLRRTRNAVIQDSEIRGLDAGAGRLMVAVKDVYADSTGTRCFATTSRMRQLEYRCQPAS